MLRSLAPVVPAALAAALAPAAPAQTARLDAPLVVADEFHRFESILDLDDDGDTDAFDWWWVNDDYEEVVVTGWLNDGSGQLVETWNTTLTLGDAFGVEHFAGVGDFDGDGRDDMALAFLDDVWILTSNGAAAPTQLAVVDTPVFEFHGLMVADYDGDGLDDFAITNGWVTVYLNQGGGVFTLAEPSWNTLSAFQGQWRAADLDGDGDPDLVKTRGILIDVYYLEDGVRVGTESIVHGVPSSEDNMLATGDVDGDADRDVVVFGPTGQYAVVRRSGGGFVADPVATGGPATDLADVDGDGDLDGVCCGGGGDGLTRNVWPSRFEIATNDGTGAFAPSFQIENLGSHHLAGVADLDADGDADLVAGRTVYYACGPITASPYRDLADLAAPGAYGFGSGWSSDCDGDGDDDLGFSPSEVLSSWGDATYEMRALTPPGPGPWVGPGHAGDFDGDGDVDLVVTQYVQQGLFNIAFVSNHLLRNNGSGVLSDAGLAADPALNMSPGGAWDSPEASLVADLDGDDDLDLVVHGSTTYGPGRLWLNDGSGSFAHAGDVAGRVQAVADMDGDDVVDLVLNDGDVRIALGQGGGAFGAPGALGHVLDQDDRVAVVDADGDGDLDVVAPKNAATTIHLFTNDGAGSFTNTVLGPERLNANAAMAVVLAIDVDADGLDDLVAWPAQYAHNCAHVFLKRDGAPGFEQAAMYSCWPTGTTDVDGDGDLDLMARLDEAQVDVLVTNTAWDGPGSGARSQYGYGAPGTGGVVPLLGARGPFRLGETPAILLRGMRGNAIGLMTVSFAPSELPNTPWLGTTGYNWPWFFYFFIASPPGAPGVEGSSSLTLPFFIDQALVDVGDLYHQVYWGDPGGAFGRSATAGLFIDYQ